MRRALLLSAVLISLASTAAAGSLRGGRCALPGLSIAMSTITGLTATPGSISFSANNPNAGTVAGSSAAAVNWSLLDGVEGQSWMISVQASSSSFTSCPSVPVSAVTVACASASVGGGNGGGSCGSPFTLSTVSQQVANGTQGTGMQGYSVQLLFTLAESWRYVANPSCSLTLTYTINAL